MTNDDETSTESATPPSGEVDSRVLDVMARARAGDLLGPADMMVLFRMSTATFYRCRARGDFDFLKTQHPIGTHIYAGVLVARLLAAEPLYEQTFSRKRRR